MIVVSPLFWHQTSGCLLTQLSWELTQRGPEAWLLDLYHCEEATRCAHHSSIVKVEALSGLFPRWLNSQKVWTLPFDSFQRASPISLAIISELCGSLFLFFLSFTIKISNQCNDDVKFIYNSLNKYSRDKILAAVPPYCLILVRRLKRSKHVHGGLKAVFTLLVIYDSKNQNHPSWFLIYPIHLF